MRLISGFGQIMTDFPLASFRPSKWLRLWVNSPSNFASLLNVIVHKMARIVTCELNPLFIFTRHGPYFRRMLILDFFLAGHTTFQFLYSGR